MCCDGAINETKYIFDCDNHDLPSLQSAINSRIQTYLQQGCSPCSYQSLCQMQNFKLTFNLNVSIICQNSIIKEATKCNNSDLDTQEFFIVES